MKDKSEKMILKKILENKLTIDHKHMTIEKLTKTTGKTDEELYKIISLLLTREYIKMRHTDYHCTVNPFYITEKGLNSLEINWRRRILDAFIPIATIVSIIAIILNLE